MTPIATTSAAITAPASNGCCGRPAPGTTVPALVFNPSGLSAITYRIGTFTSFRQAMLDSIALPDLMATSVTTLTSPVGPADTSISVLDASQFPLAPNFRIKIGSEYLQVIDGAGTSTWRITRGSSTVAHFTGDMVILDPPNPFASWHAGTGVDYHTIFVELWAYLADIITFYQERIANEAYLGTASQRDSLLRLVSLIDYHPAPGAGASGLVAFTAAKNRSRTVPAGFRVGSKPLPGKPAVVFETASAVEVSGENSTIALSLLSPDVPFPPHTIVLQGVNNGLAVDDYILAVENPGTSAEQLHLLRIATIKTDKQAVTTTITWQQEIGEGPYAQASKQVSVYALRVAASPIGANAPQWDGLSPTLNNSDGKNPKAPYRTSWEVPSVTELEQREGLPSFTRFRNTGANIRAIDQPLDTIDGFVLVPNPWFYVPVIDDPRNLLFLDAVYKQLNYTPQNPGWAVLLTDGDVFQILHVTDARQAAKVAYSLSLKVTRLTFAEDMMANTFPIRNTLVLTGSELLTLQVDLPLPDSVSGSQLILQGVNTQLQPGQTIIFQGNFFDPATNSPTSIPAAEPCALDGPAFPDLSKNVTTINLKTRLARQYVRATCSVMANIVEVTQGETVKDEVLGSSDGSAFQSYALKKKPLTYLPATDAEGLAAVKSTLAVIVNGVAWNEQPNLAHSAPDAQDFTTTLDDPGQTTVVFGDGFTGARPPSGINNVHARYRNGLGTSGNLPSGSIQQLIDSVPDVQKVTNPVPSSGGSDPEEPGQIRALAPASLRTFSRAVSASDYAALATNFPGIAKATASWIVRDAVTQQAVAHPYLQLTVATQNQEPIQGTLLAGKLRRFLDNHRDPNVLLRIQDYSPVYIEVAVQIEIDNRFPHQGTLTQAQAALNPGVNPDGTAGYFAFERLQFGQTIFLSAVYAVVQDIPGVKDVWITSLRRVGPVAKPSGTVHDIAVGPTEIAAIGPAGAGQGQLTVGGRGGFIDT